MIENKKWESLVWIVIWILLLTFVILGLYNLILYSESTNITFEENSIKWILSDNTQSVLYKLNINGINEWSGFYLHKNNTTKSFDVYTGAINLKYKYIDKFWEFVSTGATDRDIYSREIILEKIDTNTNTKLYKVKIDNYYKQ